MEYFMGMLSIVILFTVLVHSAMTLDSEARRAVQFRSAPKVPCLLKNLEVVADFMATRDSVFKASQICYFQAHGVLNGKALSSSTKVEMNCTELSLLTTQTTCLVMSNPNATEPISETGEHRTYLIPEIVADVQLRAVPIHIFMLIGTALLVIWNTLLLVFTLCGGKRYMRLSAADTLLDEHGEASVELATGLKGKDLRT